MKEIEILITKEKQDQLALELGLTGLYDLILKQKKDIKILEESLRNLINGNKLEAYNILIGYIKVVE